MEFYGLVGEKLTHSLSPQIHKQIFDLLNIEGAYKLFEIPKDNIHNLGESIKLLGIKGVNVTIPYKKVVMDQLDYISPEAKKIGAVNTILLNEGKLEGYNSDYYGFGMMLERKKIAVDNKTSVVLGNGGAAKAVITYLIDNGAKEVYLVTRNKENNKTVDNNIKLIDYKDLEGITGDILINTTPVGMYPNEGYSPVSVDIIKKYDAIVDIIYNPGLTEFLRLGKENNKVICGGLYMLVGQGIKSQEIWQDRKINKDVIERIYMDLKKNFE